MTRNRAIGVILGMAVLAMASSAQAVVIQEGLYRLHNHPDGEIRDPGYGFRLDGLDGNTGHDFTFDFDHADSAMFLDYDAGAGTIRIFGTAFGGRDIGSTYSATMSGLWEIDFTFAEAVRIGAGDDDLLAGPNSDRNIGTITRLFPHATLANGYSLVDAAMSDPYTFRFGDENNDLGHRGFSGISGWGWVNHSGYNGHVPASDWLFTAEPIPAPGAVLLAAMGLGMINTVRRRFS